MKLEIDSTDIFKIIETLLEYPAPQVCRHWVIGQLVMHLLEDKDFPIDENFKKFVHYAVRAKDEEALEYVQKLKKI